MKILDLLIGELGRAGEIGSGNFNISSNSSFLAPWASLRACDLLMYCNISSSPRISSSSTEDGTGDGVENDWRLEVGDPFC